MRERFITSDRQKERVRERTSERDNARVRETASERERTRRQPTCARDNAWERGIKRLRGREREESDYVCAGDNA